MKYLRLKCYVGLIASLFVLLLASCGESSINEQESFSKAVAFQQENEHSSAIIEFKNVIKVNPDRYDVKVLLADSYIHIGMYPFAEKELSKALTQESSPALKIKLASVLLMLSDMPRLEQVLQDRQDWPAELQVDALALLAQFQQVSGHSEQSQTLLEQAKELNVITAELLFSSALQALAYDDTEEAFTNVNLALDSIPSLLYYILTLLFFSAAWPWNVQVGENSPSL